ncbi:MAG: ATP-binding protein [Saprospiraceae bacterium]|nr:ATP-binding protein [Saprospiraceae bacterium]
MHQDTTIHTNPNALQLKADLEWFAQVVQTRMELYFEDDCAYESIFDLTPPAHPVQSSLYANILQHYGMTAAERIALLLGLAPHLQPQLLDVFFVPNERLNRGHTEFGGLKGDMHSGFLPTGETLLFVLAGDDLEERLYFQKIFERDHFFNAHKICQLEQAPPNEPRFSGAWMVTQEVLDLLSTGVVRKPDFSPGFPARLLYTPMEWDDLVLNPQTEEQLQELNAWIMFEEELMDTWGMDNKLKPGYRCLFHGPPGTGKTLTASLLGKKFGKDVYRVDLSALISKYIGETEKNLERIFERTEHTGSILFFDEADAIFGKRTNVNEAHDRYANQEVSYLLQRIEDYPGIVLLASNFKTNMDDAFLRRFQSTIFFPLPEEKERLQLWKNAFSDKASLEETVDMPEVAKRYKLSGGAIMNVVRYASLMTLQRGSTTILLSDLQAGVRRELAKEGKTM